MDDVSIPFFNRLVGRAVLWLLAGMGLALVVSRLVFLPGFESTFTAELQKRGDSLTHLLAQHQDLRLALALKQDKKAEQLAEELLKGDSDMRYIAFLDGSDKLLAGSASGGANLKDLVERHKGAAGDGVLRFTLDVTRQEAAAGGDFPLDDAPAKQAKLGVIYLGLSPDAVRSQISNLTYQTIALTAGIVVAIAALFFSRLSARLRRLVAFSLKVASGDLRVLPEDSGSDEIGRLAAALAQMTRLTGNIIGRLQHAAQSLAVVSNEVLSSATQQNQSATKQAASVTETGATVAQLREAFSQASERAQKVIDLAKKSEDATLSGRGSVEESVKGMEQIRDQVHAISRTMVGLVDRTGQIASIIDAVNDLAEQSNVLALNAAIEAAKAGEQGKGFAVVAREVRSLAERSKDSTSQVRAILQDIEKASREALVVIDEGSRKAQSGSELSLRAGSAIALLDGAISESSTAAKQIAASTRQQAVGVDQIWQAMREIDRSVNETAANIRQLETAAKNMKQLSDNMGDLVRQYQVSAAPLTP